MPGPRTNSRRSKGGVPWLDLKTTAEERARLREWRHGDASDARAWRVAEDACRRGHLAERRACGQPWRACRVQRHPSSRERGAERRVGLPSARAHRLEPTVEESAVRVVPSETRLRRGAKLDVVAEAARDACIYPNDAGPGVRDDRQTARSPRRAGGPMSDIDELDRRGCSAPRRDSRRSKRRCPVVDMKTTQERRDRFREWLRRHARPHEHPRMVRRGGRVPRRGHLLAENARLRAEVAYLADGRPLDAIRRTAAEMVKLRAVAEAARDMMRPPTTLARRRSAP